MFPLSSSDAQASLRQKTDIQESSIGNKEKSFSALRETDVAAALAIAALWAMVLAFGIGQLWATLIGFGPPPASLIRYVPEVAHAFYPDALPDVRVQKRAYEVGLLAIFAPFLFILFAPEWLKSNILQWLNPWVVFVRNMRRTPILFWSAVLLVLFIELHRPAGQLIQSIKVTPLITSLILVLGFGLLANCFREKPWTRPANGALAIVLGVLIFFAAISGLIAPPDMRFWGTLTNTMVQAHFTFVVGAADRLGAGLRLFDDVHPYYGVLPEALVGVAIRAVGPLDWAMLVRCVQACQLAMLVCLTLAMLTWHSVRRPFLWLVLPTALVLPSLFTAYHMTWYPNQTGWRFFGLGLALLALALTSRVRSGPASALLGATASIALAWNPETGLIVIFGFIAYLGTSAKRPAFLPGILAACQLAMVAALGLVILAIGYWLGLGHWPLPASAEMLFGWYETFLSGFGSLPMIDIDLVALVVFVHCASLLLRGALTWRLRPIPQELRLRMAIATMILAWLPYYVNRPQTLNLWTILYLYTPLVATAFHPRRLAANWRGWRPTPTLDLLAPMLVLAGALNLGYHDMLPEIRQIFTVPTQASTVDVSGIAMNRVAATPIIAQADYLRQLPDMPNVITFSANSFVLPLLTGLYPRLPARDLFWETIREKDLQLLLDRMSELNPSTILFDADDTTFEQAYGSKDRVKFYSRIKDEIADRYYKGETASGWDIWRRK
jgi:hypothetical protein